MKWPLLSALAAATLVVGAGFVWNYANNADDAPGFEGRALAASSPGFGSENYAQAVEDANEIVRKKRAILETAPDQWIKEEALAIALMQRFRITGDYADLDEARQLLDSGLSRAPDPAGPNLTRAVLGMTEHDHAATAKALDRHDRTVVKTPEGRADAMAMRGDIAFQTGSLAEARALYTQADAIAPAIGTKVRLAEVELRTGNPRAAIAITEQALIEQNKVVPSEYARLAILLANQYYAAGDTEGAGAWIDRANEVFPGYWLAEAYAGQHLAVEGDTAGSIAALTALAEKTGEPEVIDALVGILEETGDEGKAAEWAKKSSALWEAKLAKAPAAYGLHAAEHYLDFGDAARALELVSAEVERRASPSAIEVMASSLTANGRPQEALQWLDRARDAGWDMTSLRLARADALEALGRVDEAEAVLKEAAQGDSFAGDPRRGLVRFGHY